MYTAAFAPIRTLCCVRCFKKRCMRPTGNYQRGWFEQDVPRHSRVDFTQRSENTHLETSFLTASRRCLWYVHRLGLSTHAAVSRLCRHDGSPRGCWWLLGGVVSRRRRRIRSRAFPTFPTRKFFLLAESAFVRHQRLRLSSRPHRHYRKCIAWHGVDVECFALVRRHLAPEAQQP